MESQGGFEQDTEYTNCTEKMGKKQQSDIKQKAIAECKNKRECQVSLKDLKIDKQYQDTCMQDGAIFYMQMPCVVPSDQVVMRKIFGLIIACTSIFMFFFMHLYTEYHHQKQRIKYQDWQIKTITAADYSVEFDLTPEQYLVFLNKYFDQTNPMSEMAQLRQFITYELQKKLKATQSDECHQIVKAY